jgi:hypothetical protein
MPDWRHNRTCRAKTRLGCARLAGSALAVGPCALVLPAAAGNGSIAVRGSILDGRMRRLLWLLWGLPIMGGQASAAVFPGDPKAGARLAREVCAACHVVAEDQMIDPGVGPWFVDIAQHPGTTVLSLRAFLQTPHATMPNLMLTPQETDDIISYILTLKAE